nr:DUF6551 family protein [Aureimonas mangrovi]
MRAIEPMSLPDLAPAAVPEWRPEFRWVDPRILLVDDAYQRGLSSRSVSLIRRVVGQWSFAAFKPPVVVDVEGSLHVVDGQHTAIAAASHPEIVTIPVMVIEAAAANARADAFVRHNRDRIAVTPMHLHHAMVLAGDEDAQTIAQVCERAGATILRHPPNGRYRVGDTMAVGSIRSLVERRHAMGARRVLQLCVEAGLAPIAAGHIKAVERLLFAKEYAGTISEATIKAALGDLSRIERDAARFAAEHRVPIWRGLASVIFQGRGRRNG